MPYYCNCLEVNRAAGVKITGTMKDIGSGNYQIVTPAKDGTCPLCRHHTMFSKGQPEDLRGERYSLNGYGLAHKDRKITREWLRESQVRK